MPRVHKSRSGSLQFWPRKRAKRQYPRIRSWIKLEEPKLLGFAGYKVGMTHISVSLKDGVASWPVTIIECPPLKPLSLRFYKKTFDGLKIIFEILTKNLDKELKRKIKLIKKLKEKEIPKEFDEIRLVVYTQPKLTGIGKKKPEIFEIGLSNNDLEYAKSLLDKEIKISDIFREGQFLDIHAVTKGKGFQGPIKRFGIGLKQHKSEKGVRRPGSLGAWTPKRTPFSAPLAGQLGYQTRTEYNKHLLKMSNNPEEINPKGGFPHYGFIKNAYILIKGSIAGPHKRLIRFIPAIRRKKFQLIDVTLVK